MDMSGDRILLVEDDKEIREGVEIFLKSQGYVVFQAADGIEGLKVLEDNEIDLAIVDVMMPRMDGITMTAKLREKHDFPVIFLSAKSEEVDKILGLNMGADDYITKPFTPMELLARVNSQLRRYHRFMNRLNSKQAENPKIHRLGGLEVNEETVEVMVDGSCVKVTPIEFKILLLLIQNPGRCLLYTSYIRALSQFMNIEMDVSVPELCIDMAGAILSYPLSHWVIVSDDILLIENRFQMSGKAYRGHILFLPEQEDLGIMLHRLRAVSYTHLIRTGSPGTGRSIWDWKPQRHTKQIIH